jgi:hypothetical protein
MNQSPPKPILQPVAVQGPRRLRHAPRRYLDQTTQLDERFDQVHVVQEFRLPLRVRQNGPHAHVHEAVRQAGKVNEQAVRQLDEDVLPRIADAQQAALAPRRFEVRPDHDFGAWHDRQLRAALPQLLREPPRRRADALRRHFAIALVLMRHRTNGARPFLIRDFTHCQRIVVVARSVVEAREKMTMSIDKCCCHGGNQDRDR